MDPVTGWFEIVQYNNIKEATKSYLVEKAWLCRYPRPMVIMYDIIYELLGRAFKNNLIKKTGSRSSVQPLQIPRQIL